MLWTYVRVVNTNFVHENLGVRTELDDGIYYLHATYYYTARENPVPSRLHARNLLCCSFFK